MATGLQRIPRKVWWGLGISSLLILALVLFLNWFNWNMLRGPIAREASARTGRRVRIDGDLNVHLWSWTPTITINGLKIGNPAWMGGGDLADIDRLTVSAKLLPLLVGRVELPLVDAERPDIQLYRGADNRINWQFGRSAAPAKLPPIQDFIIHDGHLDFVDKTRGLTIVGTMQSNESGAGGGSFRLVGNGSINREPFLVSISGASLMNVRHDQPYPFDANIRAGATQVIAHGELPKPFDFGQIRTALTVSGSNFANLYYLTGLALPTTPAYRLTGELLRNGTTYTFHNVAGHVGGSDLEGVFKVYREADGRPDLHANLASRKLNIADLGSLLGAPTSGIAKTPAQQADAAKLKSEGRLLPDAKLNVVRVRVMDAVLHYRAASVQAGKDLPLTSFALALTLNHGVLSADPLSFSLPHGDLTAHVRLDARPDVPLTDIDARIVNLRMEDFIHTGGQPAVEGLIEARAKLHGSGGSVHDAASSANGSLTVVGPHGEIRQVMAELLGVDVIKGLGLYLAKSQSQTNVRCAVASFQAVNGVLDARTLILDTDPVLVTGTGSIDMRAETVNLALTGHPKKFQLIRLKAPITVTGKLRSPKIGVKAGQVGVQVAEAVALGAVLSPLAAILPFVDPGLTKNADCAGLIAQAGAQGAPVKAATTTR